MVDEDYRRMYLIDMMCLERGATKEQRELAEHFLTLEPFDVDVIADFIFDD